MIIFDKMPVGTSRRRTTDGYLVAQGHAARTGVQTYLGSEVGKPGAGVVRVFRPEAEVFDKVSVRSFGNKPITVGHPPEGVTADNWRTHAVGYVGGENEILRDGDRLSVPLLFTDSGAIAQLESGVSELSAGYECDLDWTPGKTAAGDAYDAVQRKIHINHVALVPVGRAGPTVRVADALSGAQNMELHRPGYRMADASAFSDEHAAYLESLPGSPTGLRLADGGGAQTLVLTDEMFQTMDARQQSIVGPLIEDMNGGHPGARARAAEELYRYATGLKLDVGAGRYDDDDKAQAAKLAEHCLGLCAVVRAA